MDVFIEDIAFLEIRFTENHMTIYSNITLKNNIENISTFLCYNDPFLFSVSDNGLPSLNRARYNFC